VPEWKLAPGPDGVTSEMQAEMVRDFLFGLTPDAKFPASLDEVADSPLVKQRTPEQLKAEMDAAAAGDKGKDKKDKDKKGDKKGPAKKTGQIQGPARF